MRSLAVLFVVLVASSLHAESKKYALLIGVNKYEHGKLLKLEYAVNDATELRDVLKEAGYETTLLTDESGVKPTGAAIVKSVGDILRKSRAGDTVVFAFAGHGVQFEGDKDSYFCPADARPFKDETKTLVSMGTVYQEMEKSFAGVKILLVDACRDDPRTGRASRGIDADSAPRPPRGVAAFFSCSAGQVAYELPALQHGVFFHHVLQGLKGKAKNGDEEVTFNSLVDYVGKNVERDVAKRVGGGAIQQPNQKADLTGGSPVLLELAIVHPIWPGQKEYDEARRYTSGMGRKIDLREGVGLQRRASELGHPIGKVMFADSLRSGQFVPKDEALAMRLEAEAIPEIRKAALQNHPSAQNALGNAYLNGRGVEKDEKQAVEWFRKAAEQKYLQAQSNLGTCYAQGRGVAKDDKQAVEWYRKAADQNHAGAQNNLGNCYANGRGVAKDEKQAVEWYRNAAEKNHSQAQYSLGIAYTNGRGVDKDESEGVKWFRKAGEQNNVGAQSELAYAYMIGRGLNKDESEGVKWYRKAAEQNNSGAQYNLGIAYMNGRGVDKDESEGVKWYRKAADQKYAPAQYSLGYFYQHGLGVQKDEKQAADWYRKAADQNHVIAQNDLGYCYQYGLGVQKDEKQAANWYLKAADQKYAVAQNNIGGCYLGGLGVAKDEKQAVEWYRRAAEQNNSMAQHNLGYCYENGFGVSKDENQAIEWYRKAAAQKNDGAIAALKRLEK